MQVLVSLGLMVNSIKFFFILILFLNCSVLNKKNLVLVNAVEENLIPDEAPAKYYAAPIYIPLGIIGGMIDVFVIHPIRVIPASVNQTIDKLWVSDEKGYVTRMGSIPFLTIATPIFFTFDWMFRAFGDKNENYEDQKFNKIENQLDYEKNFYTNLNKSKNENDKLKISSELNQCYSKNQNSGFKNFETYQLLISVFKESKSDPKFHSEIQHSLIHCLRTNEKTTYLKLENFLFEELDENTDHIQIMNLVSLFQNFNTKESSEQILKKIISPKIKSETRRSLIDILYSANHKEVIDEFESLLKK